MARPILDTVELQQVQQIDTEQDQVLVQHGVPALEGDFLQGLGRRATRVTLNGVLTGPEVADGLKTLREKFRAAQPVPFVSDITTATKIDQVLIEEMGVREVAGKPQRFEYAFTLREFTAAAAPQTEEPPPPRRDVPDPEVATLEVEVVVEGDPNFDFSDTRVTVDGTQGDGASLSRTLTERENNVWTERDFPPGQFTARAVVSEPSMSGSSRAVVRAGQTTRITITLQRGQVTNIAKAFIVHFRFDKAFVEPCMRYVLKQVVDYASAHSDEKLLIVGHTDKTGSDAYNQSLSERRARSVYAYVTMGRDRAASLAEWNALRVQRPAGELPSIKDSWGTFEYQYILQDLGFYTGNVDNDHGPQTDQAVRDFQKSKGLEVDGIVGDATWTALIDDYTVQDQAVMTIAEGQFFKNAKDGCDGGILKWLGCGEEDPVKNTEAAWRPNRRVELLFVKADRLLCDVPKPVTFNLPQAGAVSSQWCLGPDTGLRNCFLTRKEAQPNKWLAQPAEPDQITVSGSLTFDDGTPAANMKYILIAPDGEFMDGEKSSGEGIPARTKEDGTFEYPDKPKGVGIYTLMVIAPLEVRDADAPPEAAKGNIVCLRLDSGGGA